MEFNIDRMQNTHNSFNDTVLFTKSIVGLYPSKIRKVTKIPDKTINICGKKLRIIFIIASILPSYGISNRLQNVCSRVFHKREL